jgi:hypothetical protein
VAIGGLDQAGRLDQLRTFAVVLLRSGYRPDAQVRADVYEALDAELGDPARAQALTEEFLARARADWVAEAASWPAETDFDRIQAAFAELEDGDVVVLQAIDDHWVASDLLKARAAAGSAPRGLAYFTHTDVWHAVEHHMLEINLWHGNEANITDSDGLLTTALDVFQRHGLPAHFDEGRIEVNVSWDRRPLIPSDDSRRSYL